MTKRLDPARDDAGVRLRTARLRCGMTQTAVADLACISPAFVSMVETGDRELTRVCDIVALADVLRISPLYLADGRVDTSAAGQRPTRTVPSPGPHRSPHAGPAPAARPAVHPARPSGRPRHGGLAAPPGPRRHREPVAAHRPARRLAHPTQITVKEMSHI